MAQRKAKIWRINKFHGGLSEGDKIGLEGAFLSGECLDIRGEPNELTLNSLTTQETMASGATMASIPKWIAPAGGIGASNPTVDTYCLNRGGYLFRKPQGGTTWENRASLASCSGQGLAYFPVDDSLYFAGLATLARYGPLGWASAPSVIPLTGTAVESLQEDADYHPLREFHQYICIGNGRYVGTWDGTTMDADKIDTYRGWRVRALEVFEDHLVIGCWKGTNIGDYDKGMIFYWDGTATTWNFFTEIEGGGVNALAKVGGDLLIWAGPRADLYAISYPGADPKKIKSIRSIEEGATGEILPGGVSVWGGIPYFGFPGAGTVTTALKGVYGYGTESLQFPPSLNLDYRISAGSVGSPSTFVGAVKGLGPSMFFVGWDRGGTYGIDNISPGTPYSEGIFTSLILDDEELYRRKTAYVLKVTMEPLETGQSITVKYEIDRGKTSGTIGTASFATDGAIVQKQFDDLPLPFKFYEVGLTLEIGATATAPKITSVSLVFEPEESVKGGSYRVR